MMSRSNVVVIAGPCGTAFNKHHVSSLEQAFLSSGANILMVGDGESNISTGAIEAAIVTAAQSEGSVMLFIMAHGDVRNNEHVINIAGNYELTTKSLFQTLSRIVNRQLDVFMTCCHGGASISAINTLPRGSTLVTLCPRNESVSGFDLDNFINTLSTDLISNPSFFTAENFLNIYLGKALRNRIPPARTISGEGVHVLVQKLRNCIGKEYSALERESVHQKLDVLFSVDVVDQLLNTMATARIEADIEATEFGPCLAISDVLRPQQLTDIESYGKWGGYYSYDSIDPMQLKCEILQIDQQQNQDFFTIDILLPIWVLAILQTQLTITIFHCLFAEPTRTHIGSSTTFREIRRQELNGIPASQQIAAIFHNTEDTISHHANAFTQAEHDRQFGLIVRTTR